ncbi:MAG: lactonase family protein, partial [Candidatus Acidiferrum sp.]
MMTLPTMLLFVVGAAMLFTTETVVAADPSDHVSRYWVFVGTYTGAKSKGIYRFELDPATGKLDGGELAAETVNPSFLAIHPSSRFLYAVSEIGDFGKKKTGAV